MTQFQVFEFNPFAENTYVVWDETGDCAIFDPGCYMAAERADLQSFIQKNKLRPTRLINTHCHIDHVFGNAFVAQTWDLALEIHRGEIPVLESFPMACQMFGVPFAEKQPKPGRFIEAGEIIRFGNTEMKALFTPGHSPASLSFYVEKEGFVLAGDVLFFESIGRTDLPGGNFETLKNSIETKLFSLPGETLVLPGHGPSTTVRHEKEYNPFVGV